MAASPRDMRAALHRARLRVTRGLRVAYNPRTDGKPDPGEVVWAWVPYEEDALRISIAFDFDPTMAA